MDPRKEFRSQRPETHEEWQARMGGEVLAVVRSGLYPDFAFDMAPSASTPAPMSASWCWATDGQMLYYSGPSGCCKATSRTRRVQPGCVCCSIPLCIPPSVAQRPQGAVAVEPGLHIA